MLVEKNTLRISVWTDVHDFGANQDHVGLKPSVHCATKNSHSSQQSNLFKAKSTVLFFWVGFFYYTADLMHVASYRVWCM